MHGNAIDREFEEYDNTHERVQENFSMGRPIDHFYYHTTLPHFVDLTVNGDVATFTVFKIITFSMKASLVKYKQGVPYVHRQSFYKALEINRDLYLVKNPEVKDSPISLPPLYMYLPDTAKLLEYNEKCFSVQDEGCHFIFPKSLIKTLGGVKIVYSPYYMKSLSQAKHHLNNYKGY